MRYRGALRPGLDAQEAAAILFAICANETIFVRLIDECGCTADQYADLIERLVNQLFLHAWNAAGMP